jgi:hypothetical protein
VTIVNDKNNFTSLKIYDIPPPSSSNGEVIRDESFKHNPPGDNTGIVAGNG